MVGNFSNAGQDYQLKGKPLQVNTHNFPDKELGKVCPYGIYDITKNKGWVNIGIDHDTYNLPLLQSGIGGKKWERQFILTPKND